MHKGGTVEGLSVKPVAGDVNCHILNGHFTVLVWTYMVRIESQVIWNSCTETEKKKERISG
jgi:hypothetical protein